MAFDIDKIEEKIDRVATAGIEINDEGSGIEIKRLVDAMEVAKVMSISKQAVPAFMRGEPGICYAMVVRAVRWRMDPFFVAEQSYIVRNPKSGEEKIAFQAQLVNAVINARAPLQKKLWAVYVGEGEAMKCTVYGLPKGQTEPLDFETPTLKELIAVKGRNEAGHVKGSPLYDNDPKQALWYYGARGFCRRHFPEVLAGVYDVDEFEPVEARDVTPAREGLTQRLKGQKRISSARGFDAGRVNEEIGTKSAGNPNHPPGHDGRDMPPAEKPFEFDETQNDPAVTLARPAGSDEGPSAAATGPAADGSIVEEKAP